MTDWASILIWVTVGLVAWCILAILVTVGWHYARKHGWGGPR